MPSPLGHALGAAAAGWAVAPPLTGPRERAFQHVGRRGVWFAMLGMLPDIDLMFGIHRGPTHALGAALVAGLAAAAFTRNGRLGIAAGCAYATHTLLDWLGSDTSVPVGIMALWPVSREYYHSTAPLFDAVWRHNETPDFWSHNIQAVARELIILVPVALLALRAQRRRGGRRTDQYL